MTELGPEARALLEVASGGDEPSGADRARVRAALGARLAITAVAAGVALTAAASSSAAGAASASAGTGAAVGAGAAGAAGAAGIAGAATIAAPIGIGMKLLLVFGAVTAVGVGAVSYVESTPLAPKVVHVAPSVAAPRDPILVAPLAPPAASSAAALAASAAPDRPSAALDQARPSPSAPAVPSGDAIDRELGLLREAQLALQAGDGARALVLLDEHARRFPAGSLGEEREAARVFALCSLGRTAEARAAADRFLRVFPRSPQAGRVRASCGGATF